MRVLLEEGAPERRMLRICSLPSGVIQQFELSCREMTLSMGVTGSATPPTSVALFVRWWKCCSERPLKEPLISTVSGMTLAAPSPAHHIELRDPGRLAQDRMNAPGQQQLQRLSICFS